MTTLTLGKAINEGMRRALASDELGGQALVKDVAEVKVAGRRRGKSGDDGTHDEILLQKIRRSGDSFSGSP